MNMGVAESFAGEVPLLQTKGLSKAYGANRALNGVSFSLHRGQAVAVVGENGAGKSTLARILAGSILPDSGEILLEGKAVAFRSPRDALARGISFIPQELAYLSNLTVAENVLVGRWPNWRGLTSNRAIQKEAELQVRRFGIDLDVSRPMSALKLAERQLVEIVKSLAHRARVLILDEPTSALSDPESQILFRVLRSLSEQGVGLIYISHRIDEIFRFGHRIDVLRNGGLVASLSPAETKPSQVIDHMLGRAAEDLGTSHSPSDQERGLVLKLVDWSSQGRPQLSNVNVSVGRGEIVGLFGLRGCGADVVAEGLAGLRRDIRGELFLNQRTCRLFLNPRAAHRAKIIYMPPERKRDGLVLGLSVQANISLAVLRTLSRFGFLKYHAEKSLAERLSGQLNIRLQSVNQMVSQLSGGNQQKVLLASRMAAGPYVFVLHEPTRGVDVGARIEIHKILRHMADRGAAILWVTSDVEEAVVVSDRLLVMRDGALVAELKGRSKTQQEALAIAARQAP